MSKHVDFESLDFNGWTAEDEDAAIEAAASSAAIKYVVGDSTFFGRFPDGTVVATPLKFSSEIIDKVADVASGDKSEREQLSALLDLLGQKDDVAYLAHADLISVMDYAVKYFGVFERVIGLALGE